MELIIFFIIIGAFFSVIHLISYFWQQYQGNMSDLKEITQWANENNISHDEVPRDMDKLRSLTELHLSGYKTLESLPYNISALKNIKKIVITDCPLLHPFNLHSIIHKRAKNGEVEIVSIPFSNSIYTWRTAFSSNTIHNISHEAVNEIIQWADDNNISDDKLPRDDTIKYLTDLNLSYCTREWIDGSFEEYIEPIYDGCGSIEYIPESIGELKNITSLNLKRWFALKSLPESIVELENLKELILFRCESLQYLPDSIVKLKNLEKLDLRKCQSLESLPENIGELKNLKELRLDGCRALKYIPESLLEKERQGKLKIDSKWVLMKF